MGNDKQISRIKSTSRNTVYGLLYFILNLVFSFVNRSALIYVLSESYLGLNSLFTNVLSVLSVAELGFGTVLVYNMYKPIAERDEVKVAALLRAYKLIYICVGLVVSAVGLILMPFLPYLIKDDTAGLGVNIYVLFAIYLINTVIGYFFSYKRSLIFAHQRNDIENKSKIAYLSTLNILQIIVLFATKNYTLYVAVMPIATAVDCAIIYFASSKLYKYPKGGKLDAATKKDIKKNVMAMLCHKIGSIIVFGTDSILISAFLGLAILGKYSNYMMIISALTSMLTVFVTAMQASVGDSVARRSPEENYELFKKIFFAIAWLNGLFTICCICLFQHFMTEWSRIVGKDQLLDFLCMFLLAASFFFTTSRRAVGLFKDVKGLFIQDAYKPIVESIINIVMSILLCRYIGLAGIILGTILSSAAFAIWVETYVLYKHYFKRNFMLYFARYGINLLIFGAVGTAVYFLCSIMPASGIGWFIVKAAVCLVVINLLFALIFCRTAEFRYFRALAYQLFSRLTRRGRQPESGGKEAEARQSEDGGEAEARQSEDGKEAEARQSE